jgi:hypothetical protein
MGFYTPWIALSWKGALNMFPSFQGSPQRNMHRGMASYLKQNLDRKENHQPERQT